MLATLFDPNEFGGCFLSVHSNAHYTIFVDLVEILLRSSQKDKENRTVDDSLQDFKLIVKCLVEDLGMPIRLGHAHPASQSDDPPILWPACGLHVHSSLEKF